MIATASFSDCGGREYNEDFRLIVNKNNKLCAMVADGLGGHGGGSIASSIAVNTIKECFEAQEPDKDIEATDINMWFESANEKVLEQQTRECKMKTTMAMLCFRIGSNTVTMAHLGDTRIYHFIDGTVNYVSFDHSVSRMAVLAGEISMDEIRFHTDRNKLLKAVGKDDEVLPEIKELILDRSVQNAFLICTDGFWEYVTEAQMEATLRDANTPKEWLESMRRYILEGAKEGNDNNTAIAIFM